MDGNDLLLWRRRMHLTQLQLAKHLGKGVATIARWERGTTLPDGLAADLKALEPRLLGTASQGPEFIAPDAHKGQYYWMSNGHGGFKVKEPKPTHPVRLFPGRWPDGQIPATFLQDAEYAAAVERWHARIDAEMEAGNRRARQEVLDNPPPTLPHAASCRCSYCNTVRTIEKEKL